MKLRYHRLITTQALEKHISPAALKSIIDANFGQDAFRYQFGHDHFHYDGSSFPEGDAYIEGQRRLIVDALAHGEALPAWQAFGRLAHAIQDFYAHSNYVTLWRERYPAAVPNQIHPLLGDALSDSRLHSGRLYYPLEILTFVPALQALVLPFLPRNSHAWMNKDDPSRPDFDFAYMAAVKRTELEFQNMIRSLVPAQAVLFIGKS
jgi:hypothetical protein